MCLFPLILRNRHRRNFDLCRKLVCFTDDTNRVCVMTEAMDEWRMNGKGSEWMVFRILHYSIAPLHTLLLQFGCADNVINSLWLGWAALAELQLSQLNLESAHTVDRRFDEIFFSLVLAVNCSESNLFWLPQHRKVFFVQVDNFSWQTILQLFLVGMYLLKYSANFLIGKP